MLYEADYVSIWRGNSPKVEENDANRDCRSRSDAGHGMRGFSLSAFVWPLWALEDVLDQSCSGAGKRVREAGGREVQVRARSQRDAMGDGGEGQIPGMGRPAAGVLPQNVTPFQWQSNQSILHFQKRFFPEIGGTRTTGYTGN